MIFHQINTDVLFTRVNYLYLAIELFRYQYQYWKIPPKMVSLVSTLLCELIQYHVIYWLLNSFFVALKQYTGSYAATVSYYF